jgi:hypothetical protein
MSGKADSQLLAVKLVLFIVYRCRVAHLAALQKGVKNDD